MKESKKASALGPNLSFPKLFEEIGKFLPSSRLQVLESFYKQYRVRILNFLLVNIAW